MCLPSIVGGLPSSLGTSFTLYTHNTPNILYAPYTPYTPYKLYIPYPQYTTHNTQSICTTPHIPYSQFSISLLVKWTNIDFFVKSAIRSLAPCRSHFKDTKVCSVDFCRKYKCFVFCSAYFWPFRETAGVTELAKSVR